MDNRKYREYFSIDEDYFSQVTPDLISEGKVSWKKFYPHETFIKLIKDTVSVLTRQQKLSIWVEGAYGTGKSHAVLTLKNLLDASETDTKEYFEHYGLNQDLFNKFQGLKNQDRILTVHKYGSSGIIGDKNLILSIQESIMEVMKENGIKNKGEEALKGAVIAWLTDETHKRFFNDLIVSKYDKLFDSENVDSIIEQLRTLSQSSLIELMNKIFNVADEEGINTLKMDIDGLIKWIKDIISKNELKALVVIWDEFTEYFQTNRNQLTGFQKLVELSATQPFCLIIVTHKSAALFDDTDKDKMKILDRFVSPTCKIQLPDTMAFELMAAAMTKNPDPVLRTEWDDAEDDLNSRLHDARNLVKESAKIDDDKLKAILPIHPYTALLLKYISSAFDSNQRSMFDFIKNDRGEDIKGFQWFIDHFGPDDDDPLLTIDMLWDFFYEKGRDNLSADVRIVLDCYARNNTEQLEPDTRKVLKTILMLQAISQRVGDSVELFVPNVKNINSAYEGSELDNGKAESIANMLVQLQILFKKPTGQNKFQYSALMINGDGTAIEKEKEQIRNSKKTYELVAEGNLESVLNLPASIACRYEIKTVTAENFKQTINKLRNLEDFFGNKIVAVMAFARNDQEAAAVTKQIIDAVKDGSYKMIFIDASATPFGQDEFEQYADNLANCKYQLGKDNQLSKKFEEMANIILKNWFKRIAEGSFAIYTTDKPSRGRFNNIEEVCEELRKINASIYQKGIEQFRVTDQLFENNSFPAGVGCGAEQKTSGRFLSGNVNTKLEKALEGAWNVDRYWEKDRNLPISQIKNALESEIEKEFEKEGRISISHIYNMLKEKPYGFMPCNLSAFVLGFLLKEYAQKQFRWSDGGTSDDMSIDKLKEMVSEVIKNQITPNSRYKEKYIVKMTEEDKVFIEVTSYAFGISANLCVSVEQTRDRIRDKIKELSFPIWCLKYIIADMSLCTDSEVIEKLIDYYGGIVNSNNLSGNKTDADIAIDIGKLCIDNPTAKDELKGIITKENCKAGMKAYIAEYNDGELVKLANSISDNSEYINAIGKKFDAEDANWVWKIETANKKIDEVIIEYKIVQESSGIISKTNNFSDAIVEWCEKVRYIKLSFETIKNSVNDVRPFLEILLSLKKSGQLLDSQKSKFLELLLAHKNAFKEFYYNQIIFFKEVCEFYLDGLSDEEIKEVFNMIPTDMFTKEKSEYVKNVESKVSDFKKNQGKAKLKKLWKEKTETASPFEWSNKFKTPILCMVSKDELIRAKQAFATINKNNPDSLEIDKALDYLIKATFYEKLNNSDLRDKAFTEKIVKNFSVMLYEPNDVRKYLMERMSSDAYYWFESSEVENVLRKYAEAEYDKHGSDEALQVIENMDEVKLKVYLRRLIKDNMIVGMEIIKDK